jgi:hypothetical protein
MRRPVGESEIHKMRTVASLLMRPGAVAGYISAAVIHDLLLFQPEFQAVHLLRDTHSPGPRGRVHVHPLDAPVVLVDGLPVTDVATTLIDCARTQPRDTAVVMFDDALHRGLVTREELENSLRHRHTAWGISRARTALDLADGRAESAGESRTRLICLDAKIRVTPQVEVRDESGQVIARLDLKVDGFPLGIEFDGQSKYGDFADDDAPDSKYWKEKLRKEQVEDHGHILVSVHWALLDTPDRVEARIRRAMERAVR